MQPWPVIFIKAKKKVRKGISYSARVAKKTS